MLSKNMKTETLTAFLDSKSIAYTIDNSPSATKMNRIEKAIARKENLMHLAVSFYKQVKGA